MIDRAAGQSQSGRVVSDAKHTAAYDAFMKTNRFREAPQEDESPDAYWGQLKTRLENQAGRVLIKRPEEDFSEEAFRGWLIFMRAYGEETGVGNCTACHTTPNFTDGKKHDIGTGSALVTPSLRDVAKKSSFLRDGSAKTLTEAIAAHAKPAPANDSEPSKKVDANLGRIALTDDEVVLVAEFVKSLKTSDRDRFREYLINIVVQPLDLDF